MGVGVSGTGLGEGGGVSDRVGDHVGDGVELGAGMRVGDGSGLAVCVADGRGLTTGVSVQTGVAVGASAAGEAGFRLQPARSDSIDRDTRSRSAAGRLMRALAFPYHVKKIAKDMPSHVVVFLVPGSDDLLPIPALP